MEIKDKICVVTGAASGIGKALCMAFAKAGARQVVCVDMNGDGAGETAEAVGGAAYTVDVADEAQIKAMIDNVERDIGPIDLYWSNAGIAVGGGMETPNSEWQRTWDINVMAHVWAARHLVPLMAARGGGYLLNTASAAGLLNQIGSASYGVTKHAAIGLAEWIALTHGDEGIKVSVLCPQAVRTEMTRGHEDHVAAINGMMEPEPVAQICLEAIREETFLILPHEEVRTYMKNKTDDYDRWIGGMRKLNRKFSDKKM
ncbi:SDR family oxidoreductase [Sulfitobacter pacificus]|uniref:SDR family oxidoreductase n=1 Tax=Sulfitobacter pacificus TaxID=1499314 RepID=UPI003108FB8F